MVICPIPNAGIAKHGISARKSNITAKKQPFITGATGTMDAAKTAGETGAGGCPCTSMGKLLINGGMEAFTAGIPDGWNTTTPDLVAPVTLQGRVHSGNSAVNLAGGAALTQTVSSVQERCFYDFSFFAHAEGAQVGVVATVTFITPPGKIIGALITVNQEDIPNGGSEFSYYRIITAAAPMNVTSAIITFLVAAPSKQSLDIDDVSLSVA